MEEAMSSAAADVDDSTRSCAITLAAATRENENCDGDALLKFAMYEMNTRCAASSNCSTLASSTNSSVEGGASVGACVRLVGAAVAFEGVAVGAGVGTTDGAAVGAADGAADGAGVGAGEGAGVGTGVGSIVGLSVGNSVGVGDGKSLGCSDGMRVGKALGNAVNSVGAAEN